MCIRDRLITASAGNHAQGVAYAARLAGVKATVVMPVTTPLIKVNRCLLYTSWPSSTSELKRKRETPW